MSQQVGSIHYDLSLKTDKFDRESSNVSSSLANIGSKAKVVGAALVAAGVAAGAFAIKGAASFEQTRIGIENMLGSADAARTLLRDITEFAAQTPFEFPELADSARQLIAFGFSAETAFETMKQLGDVSAAVGAPIGDLSYLMGTLRTQGRAFMIDIRQFAQRGIPIYEYLAKVLGQTEQQIVSMIEEGKIGFPEVQKAFAAMTAEGGKFHNTMARQSKSLNGLFSTLKDVIGQTARELVGITNEGDVKPGSAMAILAATAQMLIETLPAAVARTKELGVSLGQYLAPHLQRVGNLLSQYLVPALNTLRFTIETQLMPALSRLWQVLGPEIQSAIKQLAPLLGGVLVAVIMGVVTTLTVLATIVSFVINVLQRLISVVQSVRAWFAQAFGEARAHVGSFFDFIQGRANHTVAVFHWMLNGIQTVLRFVGDAITAPFRAAFDWIERRVNDVRRALNMINPWHRQSPSLIDNIQSGKKQIIKDYGELFGSLRTMARGVRPDLNSATQNISNTTIGAVNIASTADADYFFSRLDRNQQLASMGIAAG